MGRVQNEAHRGAQTRIVIVGDSRDPEATVDAGDSEGEVAAYYHRIAPFFDQEQADRGDGQLWEWAASQVAGCRALEVGAGTGRATVFLARQAAHVVALDVSLELIALGRARLRGVPHVAFFAGDMRRTGLAASFDLVVAADDPFAHLLADDDRDAALAAAARHMAPGGRLILDAAWLTPERERLAARSEGLVTERFRGGGGDQLSVREELHCAGRLCTTRIEYRRGGSLLAAASFRSRLWSLAEMARRCRSAGLRVTEVWGDFDRRPWSRRHSSRLIFEARPR
jgi:SAM-dependent methyltransferase